MKIRYGNVLPEDVTNVLGSMSSLSGLCAQPFRMAENNPTNRHKIALLNGISPDVLTVSASVAVGEGLF
jgi:hypothetical protein